MKSSQEWEHLEEVDLQNGINSTATRKMMMILEALIWNHLPTDLPYHQPQAHQADIVKKETPAAKLFLTESDVGFEDSRLVQPEFGSVSLDDYVQSLKHRVKALETEEFDEYISLPEHFAEPQRLAERSPKRDSVKGSPEERQSTKPSGVNDKVKSSKKITMKEEKRGEILRMRKSPEQKDGIGTLMPFSSRVSGDGMSDCHGQYGEVITDDDPSES